MKSKVSAVKTGSWAVLTLAGLACLASACSSSGSSSGTGGAKGSGGTPAAGGSGTGGSGTGGSASGGSGMGGSGSGGSAAGGATGSGGAPVDSGAMDALRDAIVVHDGAVTAGGAYVRTGWTATAMPDHVAPNMTNPPSTESLATSNAFDGANNTRWATGVFQSTLTFPLFFTVNMQQVLNIGRITLYSGTQDTGDYPVQMDVLVSTDGVNFTPAVTAHRPMPPTTGAMNGIDTININPPVIGQWIQLKATMGQPASNNRWWAIGEMNVYP